MAQQCEESCFTVYAYHCVEGDSISFVRDTKLMNYYTMQGKMLFISPYICFKHNTNNKTQILLGDNYSPLCVTVLLIFLHSYKQIFLVGQW